MLETAFLRTDIGQANSQQLYTIVKLQSKEFSEIELSTIFNEIVVNNFEVSYVEMKPCYIEQNLNTLEVHVILQSEQEVNKLIVLDKTLISNDCYLSISFLDSQCAHVNIDLAEFRQTDTSQNPMCQVHCSTPNDADLDIGFRMIIVEDFDKFTSNVILTLQTHENSLPLSTFEKCFAAITGCKFLTDTENGIPLEYLLCCMPNVKVKKLPDLYKWILLTSEIIDDQTDRMFQLDQDNSVSSQMLNEAPTLRSLSYELGHMIHNSGKFTLGLHQVVQLYRRTFGPTKFICPSAYGETNLTDLIEKLENVCIVAGEGEQKILTLQPNVLRKKFVTELNKIFLSHGNLSISFSLIESMLSINGMTPLSFGMFTLSDLVKFSSTSKDFSKHYLIENDCIVRKGVNKLTEEQIEIINSFGNEIKELLAISEDYTLVYHQFIPSYHHHTKHQCKVELFGFYKLGELLSAISNVVTIHKDETNNVKYLKLTMSVIKEIAAKEIEQYMLQISANVDIIDLVSNVKSLQSLCAQALDESLEICNATSSQQTERRHLCRIYEVVLKNISPFVMIDALGIVSLNELNLVYHVNLATKVLQTVVAKTAIDHVCKLIDQDCRIPLRSFINRFLSKYIKFTDNDENSKIICKSNQLKLRPLCIFIRQLCFLLGDDKGKFISLEDLGNRYFSKFRHRLSSLDFGYLHLDRLMLEIPEVVQVQSNSHQCFITLKSEFRMILIDFPSQIGKQKI